MIRLVAIGFCCFLFFAGYPSQSLAGGGLFSAADSVEQTSEQIIFRQDGDITTMMVRIRYMGDAEDFGWVIPVPSNPTISTGSDLLFTDLELATRPEFSLQRLGRECQVETVSSVVPSAITLDDPAVQNVANLDVQVDQSLDVGPFETLVLQSNNSNDLKAWLADNGYLITGRGALLIEDYVQAGMKFVALKLRNDQTEGNIVPIILQFKSDTPVIPIRLTGVSTVDNLGVLVWLLGDVRAVPENYQHVVPNFTRVNWFADPREAYLSYQQLVGDAMDEIGGQGFATDFSGVVENLADHLVSPSRFEDRLLALQSLTDVEYLSSVQENFFDSRVRNAIATLLPLPDGQSETLYFSAEGLAVTYTPEQLANARDSLDQLIDEEIIDPVRRSRALIDVDAVLTRLYTTLSAEDMTADPRFVFNSDMPHQQSERLATLGIQCVDEQTQWQIELGEGTGRTGELVIIGHGDPPMSALDIDQNASWKVETTFSNGSPVVNAERDFDVVPINISTVVSFDSNTTGGGAGSTGLLSLLILLVSAIRSRGLLRGRSASSFTQH